MLASLLHLLKLKTDRGQRMAAVNPSLYIYRILMDRQVLRLPHKKEP